MGRRISGKPCFTLAWFALSQLLGAAGVAQVPAETRPNILLIMSDDQGWGDTGYGGHPRLLTPNLDALADSGLRFERMYAAAPVCSPTRASWVTGRHPRRMRIDGPNRGRMENLELTLLELARILGYQTGHFGKWHLGTLTKELADSNRGAKGNHADYSPPWESGLETVFSTEAKVPTHNPMVHPVTGDFYGTRYWRGRGASVPTGDSELEGDDSRVVADQVIEFIDAAVNAGEPFLTLAWFHTPHRPVVSDPDFSDAYLDLPGDERRFYSSISAMDAQVGRLTRHLRRRGIERETLVVFTSDNGPERLGNGSAGSTGGLRGDKRDLWEGGIRVPGIVTWEGRITPGTTWVPAVSSDFLPTLMEIWELALPWSPVLDGESLVPVIFSRAKARSSTIKFQYQSKRAVMDDQFKLVSTNNGRRWRLYDIVNDPAETSDIAGDSPFLVYTLKAEFDSWFASTEASRAGEDYDDRIASASGVEIKIKNPASFESGSLRKNRPRIYLEKQHVLLAANLRVDSDGREATYDATNPPPGAVIPAGMVVNSYLFHFDPKKKRRVAGITITFDDPILGVSGSAANLERSDFLAFRDPAFDTTGKRATLVAEPTTDAWSITGGGHTIDIDALAARSGLDELRIVTRSELQAR